MSNKRKLRGSRPHGVVVDEMQQRIADKYGVDPSQVKRVTVEELQREPEARSYVRRLRYTHGAPQEHLPMVLVGELGHVIVRYMPTGGETFYRIQRYDDWFRLQGQDMATGELIYVAEVPDALLDVAERVAALDDSSDTEGSYDDIVSVMERGPIDA